MTYTVFVHVAEEGGFWAQVPQLPGCFTEGDSVAKIEDNAREAIEFFFDEEVQFEIDLHFLSLTQTK